MNLIAMPTFDVNTRYPGRVIFNPDFTPDQLVPGIHVKVSVAREAFWAQIVLIEDGNMICRVDNDLVKTSEHGLVFNQQFLTKPEYVIDILTGDEDLS